MSKAVVLVLLGFAAGVLVGIGITPAPRSRARADSPLPASHAVAAGPAQPEAPDDALSTEVRALVSSTHPPDVPVGTGRITGTVRDEHGEPVPDVVIAAEPLDHETRPRSRRPRGGTDRDLEEAVRETVAYELWHRRAERTATTDATGRYVLEGLLDANYTFRATAHGWLIYSARGDFAAPGGTLDFIARPVGAVEVIVRGPDGTLAAGAMVWVEHDGGRGGGPWSPDHPEVELPADGRTYTLWAELGQGAAGLRSDGVPVVAARGETLPPVELRLRARTSLTVHVEMPEGLKAQGVVIAARELAEGERPDMDLLRQAPEPRRPEGEAPGTATWVDVAPGRYHVGAWWPRARDLPVVAQDEVEVREEPAEHVLRWPSPEPRETRVVRVLDPDGAPLQNDVSVERGRVTADTRVSRTLPALLSDDGSLVVHLRNGDFGSEGTNWLTAQHPLYGRVSERFDPDDATPVALRFASPIRIHVEVRGWGTTGLEGKLAVAVAAEAGVAASRTLDAKGEADLGPLQPGTYEVRLSLDEQQGPDFPLRVEKRALSSATARVELSVPPLYPLTIRCAPGARVYLRTGEGNAGSFLVRSVPEDGVLRIHLPAGRYGVMSGRARAAVQLPGEAELTLE